MKAQTHISFGFSPTDSGIQEFFADELAALIRAASGLSLLGYECAGVDLESRRVYFTPIELDKPTAASAATAPEVAVPAPEAEPIDRQCRGCAAFVPDASADGKVPSLYGHCRKHQFQIEAVDSCPEWKAKSP